MHSTGLLTKGKAISVFPLMLYLCLSWQRQNLPRKGLHCSRRNSALANAKSWQEPCLLGTGYHQLLPSSPCWPVAVLAEPWTLQERGKEGEGGLDLVQALIFSKVWREEGKSSAGVWLDSSCHMLHHRSVYPKGHCLANTMETCPTSALQPSLPWGTGSLKKDV